MRKLAILATVAVGISLIIGFAAPITAQSPLPFQSYVEECTQRCLVSDREWDEDICRRACQGEIVVTSPVSSQEKDCSHPGWRRMSDWMGKYPLWTDGDSYCVEGK